MNDFSGRLISCRKRKGLSVEQLAEKVCVTATLVELWEASEQTPDLEQLSCLAKYFGVSLDWLAGGEKPDWYQPVLTPINLLALILWCTSPIFLLLVQYGDTTLNCITSLAVYRTFQYAPFFALFLFAIDIVWRIICQKKYK